MSKAIKDSCCLGAVIGQQAVAQLRNSLFRNCDRALINNVGVDRLI